jgi:hypothetical protein
LGSRFRDILFLIMQSMLVIRNICHTKLGKIG